MMASSAKKRRWPWWVAGAILSVPAILLLILAHFDWNRLKPRIESTLSASLGRRFQIQGDLRLRWRHDPSAQGLARLIPLAEISAQGLKLANPSWAQRPYLAQLQQLTVQLRLAPLLHHRLVLSSIQLKQPLVDLERRAQGPGNWVFPALQNQPDAPPSAWVVEPGTISFDRGWVSIDDTPAAAHLKLAIEPMQKAIPYDQLVAQQGAEQGTPAAASSSPRPTAATHAGTYQFALQVQGRYQRRPVQGSAHIGAVLALQTHGEPFPIQAKLRLGDTRIALIGQLVDPLHLHALDLKLWLAGDSMDQLYPLTGVTLPQTAAYATHGHLHIVFDPQGNRFSYQDFSGRVGKSDLTGTLAFSTAKPRPKLSGRVHSKLIQLADLAPLIGAGGHSTTAAAQKTQAAKAAPRRRVLPTEPFRTERWRSMDADVALAADRIQGQPGSPPIGHLLAHLTMTGGVLTLDPLALDLAGGRLRTRLHMDGSGVPLYGTMQVSVRHMKLKELFPNVKAMHSSSGELDGQLALKVRGNSVASQLGSANGKVQLTMNDGRISQSLLEMAGLNIGSLVVSKLFGDHTVTIDCTAIDLRANHGRLDSHLFVLDTKTALIQVKGYVDMRDEQLALDIVPKTKGFRFFSLRSPLYVQGSFLHPSVGVSTGPLLLRAAAGIGLGLLAPPAALLALIAPSHAGKRDANKCQLLLQQLGRAPARHRSHRK